MSDNSTNTEGGTGADLAALQFGDSFFPSGAVSFSLGLETLYADGIVADAASLEEFLTDQVMDRWATAERAFLAAAHRACPDWAAVAEIDALQEAMTLPRELREGSRKGGAALLGVHARMETPGAAGLPRAAPRRRGARAPRRGARGWCLGAPASTLPAPRR